MPKFPYREEGNPPELRPTIDVELHHEGQMYLARALIDSGAPITVFDNATARMLMVNFGHSSARTKMIRLLGAYRQVQLEYVDFELPAEKSVQWTGEVGFITDPTFVIPFQGLLGSDGFLAKWAVTFNLPYNYFLIQHPDDAPDDD